MRSAEPQPALPPSYDEGLLDVGDGQRIWWSQSGNPYGIPALVVHGGPGGGTLSRDEAVLRPRDVPQAWPAAQLHLIEDEGHRLTGAAARFRESTEWAARVVNGKA